MTAPSFRSVSRKGEVIPPPDDLAEQYCRTVALANGLADTTTMVTTVREIDDMRTELAKAIEQRDDARAELDNAMHELRRTTQSNAGLAKWAGAYHSERDELREERDDLLREVDSLREDAVRVQELEAAIGSLTTELATARSERDTAKCAASWDRGGW